MIRIDENYTDYRIDDDPDFPGGKAVDAPTVDSIEGTPYRANWMNDINGFRQALYKKAFGSLNSISGNPDNANNSDSMKAINELLKAKSGILPSNPLAHYSCDDLPAIPDNPAGTVYRNDFQWSGWIFSDNSPLVVNNGVLVNGKKALTVKWMPITAGDFIIIRARQTAGELSYIEFAYRDTANSELYGGFIGDRQLSSEWRVFIAKAPVTGNFAYFYRGSYASEEGTLEISDFYIGNGSFLTPLIDNSGNGHHVSLTGGVIPAQGRFGRGLQFLHGMARTGVLASALGNEFTLSFWIKPLKRKDWMHFMGISNSWNLFIDTFGKLNFTIYSEGVDININIGVIPLNVFTHLLIKIQGDILYSFINGGLSAKSGVFFPFSLPSILMLGSGSEQWIPNEQNGFEGILDEIAVFDRALTDDEALALYQAPMARKAIGPSSIAPEVIQASEKGAVGGVATLNANGKLTESQKPATARDSSLAGDGTAGSPLGLSFSGSSPVMNGTASPGNGAQAARWNHAHPVDTTRAPIASPVFTGTPKIGSHPVAVASYITNQNETSLPVGSYVIALIMSTQVPRNSSFTLGFNINENFYSSTNSGGTGYYDIDGTWLNSGTIYPATNNKNYALCRRVL